MSIIDPEKIRSRLLKECPLGTRTGRTQEIASDLGITCSQVTQHKNGSRKFGRGVLAAYYYYFLYKDLRNEVESVNSNK